MMYLGHKRIRSYLVLALLILSTAPTTLNAADVTVGFVAIIDQVDEGVCICLDPDALLGLQITGYYTFDNAALDSNPGAGEALYLHSTSPYGIRVQVGNDVFGTDPNGVQFGIAIEDAPVVGTGDLYWATSGSNLPDPFYYVPDTPSRLVAVFLDGDENAIGGEGLPPGAPILADWSSAVVGIFGPNFEYSIYATITWMGEGAPSSVRTPSQAPALLSLGPNPFSSTTTLRFSVTNGGATSVRIYDVAGRLVRALDTRSAQVGQEYVIPWDARDDRGSVVPTGIYFAQLVTPAGIVSRKVTILK